MNAEEVELLSDSKYRNYVAAVDKALKNFEYSSEWADLISALGKLNKVRVGQDLSKPDCEQLHRLTQFCLFPGFAEQCKISSCPQEADNRQTAGPVPPPSPAQRRAPEGLGDLRDHFQDHWAQEAGQRPLSVQVNLIPARTNSNLLSKYFRN